MSKEIWNQLMGAINSKSEEQINRILEDLALQNEGIRIQILIHMFNKETNIFGIIIATFPNAVNSLFNEIIKLPIKDKIRILSQVDIKNSGKLMTVLNKNPEAVSSLLALLDSLPEIEKVAFLIKHYALINGVFRHSNTISRFLDSIAKISAQGQIKIFSQTSNIGNCLLAAAGNNPQLLTPLFDAINKLNEKGIDTESLILKLLTTIKSEDGSNPLLTAVGSHSIEGINSILKSIEHWSEHNQITVIQQQNKINGYNILMEVLSNPETLQALLKGITTLGINPNAIETLFKQKNKLGYTVLDMVESQNNSQTRHLIWNFIINLPAQSVQQNILSKRLSNLFTKELEYALTTHSDEFGTVLKQINQLPAKLLREIYQEKILFSIDSSVKDAKNKKLLFGAQVQIHLAVFREKINQLTDSVQNEEATKAWQELYNKWDLYQKNPNEVQLMTNFNTVLEQAKPIFMKTNQGTGLFNWLYRALNHLFNKNELMRQEEKEFRGVKFFSEEYAKVRLRQTSRASIPIQNETSTPQPPPYSEAISPQPALPIPSAPEKDANDPSPTAFPGL